jgi:FKBP-type peptidyl-prolyl cis-trans isomerase FkpA
MKRTFFGRRIGIAALAWSAFVAAEAPRDPILTQQLPGKVDAFYRTCAQHTPSGLGYTMLRDGKGRSYQQGEVVFIGYVLYLASDGSVVDHFLERPVPILPDQMIAGVAEGLKLAGQGSVIRLCIPARLGYGPKGLGPIPPDSDLVLQIEVHEIMTRAEALEHIQSEQTLGM